MGKRGAFVPLQLAALTIIFPFLRKPFPANLMLGFYATADPAQPIRTDLDNELDGGQFRYSARVSSLMHC